jgi:F420-non-reducing hydrogenase iron-sulfur subunit
MAETKSVISLVCERAADLGSICDAQGAVKDVPGLHVIKLPCSGMIQPLMIEGAMKSGAEGVIVMGCQIGDCYYREGNKMIRERLLGERQPGLKKTVDRRRVVALWLSRVQTKQFLSEAKEFVAHVRALPPLEAAKPAAGAAAKPASATPAAKAAAVPTPAVEAPKAVEKAVDTAKVADPEKASKDAALGTVEGVKSPLKETKVETGSLADNPKDGEKVPDVSAPISDVATPEPKGDETK